MTVLPGENPLAYQGKEPVARDYVFRRNPTPRDFTVYNVGDSWTNILNDTVHRLTNKANRIATWIQVGSSTGGAINQVTADTGVAIPVSGNINLTGASQGISFRGSGDTLTVTNLRDLSAFTVEPLIGGSEFTTIQAAIDAAVAAGASTANPANVLVLPGTYNENITCADGVNIIGIGGSGTPPFVNLNGIINCDQTGSVVIENLHVISTTNAFQVTTGGGPLLAEVRKCFLQSNTGTTVSILPTFIGIGRVAFIDCEVRSVVLVPVDTQNLLVTFDRCVIATPTPTQAINLRGNTTVTVERCEIVGFVLLNQASSNFISRWSNYSSLNEVFQIANAGATATLTHNDVFSNVASGDWVNGAGTLQTGFNNTLLGTAVISSAGTIVVFPSG